MFLLHTGCELIVSWEVHRRPCSKSDSTRFIPRFRKTCRKWQRVFCCGKDWYFV